MKIVEIINYIEEIFPLSFQESYDNCGLIVGDKNQEITRVLITLDCSPATIKEAIQKDCNLVIMHHPLIFQPLKRLNYANEKEKTIIDAIKNNIALYAAHTNVDNHIDGINQYIAALIELQEIKIMSTKKGCLHKLVTFCPTDSIDKVRNALFEAGAGKIGNYDCCSYNIEGKGSFRALENANPYVGQKGKIHFEPETRIETIYPDYVEQKILQSLFNSHPYEEVAYDIYPLENEYKAFGAGIIGVLKQAIAIQEFITLLKDKMHLKALRTNQTIIKKIKTIAICSGSGASFIKSAISGKVDAYITADLKYHEFFDAPKELLLIDIGHYESEIVFKNLIFEKLSKKFHNFAFQISETSTNPVQYW